MKKRYKASKLFILMLAILMAFASLGAVYASPEESDNYQIYILTESTEAVDSYAKENAYSFLEAYCELQSYEGYQQAVLGQGFKVESTNENLTLDYYMYPILIEDKIQFVFRVYQLDDKIKYLQIVFLH